MIKHRFQIYLLCFVFASLFLLAPAFAAEPFFYLEHRTSCELVDGKPNYGDAAFNRAWLDVTYPPLNKVDSLTVFDASCTYGSWNEFINRKDNTGTVNENKDLTLPTAYRKNIRSAVPVDEKGGNLYFWGNADTGFSRKKFSYTAGGKTTEGTLPAVRSTAEQMSGYVPYVEYVLNADGKISGVNWSFVDPSNPSAPLKKGSDVSIRQLRRIQVWKRKDDSFYAQFYLNKAFQVGEELSGSVTLKTPLDPQELSGIEVMFNNNKVAVGSEVWYKWYFYMPD